MIVRPSLETDAPALAAIYGHHVLHGLGSFEETPPSADDMAGRRAAVVALGLPYLVAEADGKVLGFAYAGAIGKGVGRLVLSEVLKACETLGVRQVMAVIGNSANEASIGLHRSLGFEPAGVGRALGFKHGDWVDIVWMQKALNGGASTPPDAPGIPLAGH